jgi:hypothetical protein
MADESTLPVVLKFLDDMHNRLLTRGTNAGRRGVPPEAIDRQLSQLIQFVGQARYQPADKRLRNMLPRLVPGQPGNPPTSPVGPETRAAVAWSLGMLHEKDGDPAVAAALVERLTDLPRTPAGGEIDFIRRIAAVSLGRMKSKENLEVLRSFHFGQPTFDTVDLACGWAIAQITGNPPPPPGIYRHRLSFWFITSLD